MSFFKFQRHSTISPVVRKTPIRRKGLIRWSGNSCRAASVLSEEKVALAELTTWPRLTALRATRAAMEYQLMRASVAPWSLTAIQVPPPGSDGEITVQPYDLV